MDSQQWSHNCSVPGLSHKILNLDATATIAEIKKRYRKLALQYHPDKNKTLSKNEAESKFCEITHAYKMLTDKQYAKSYEDENTSYNEHQHHSSSSSSFIFEDEFLREVFEMFDTNMDFMDSFFDFQQPNIQRDYHTTEYNNLYNDLIETNVTTDIDMVANMLEGLDVIENMLFNSNIPVLNMINQHQSDTTKSYTTPSYQPPPPQYKTYNCYITLKDIYKMKHKRILLQQPQSDTHTQTQHHPRYIYIKSYIKEQYFPDIHTNIIIKDKPSKPTLDEYKKNKKHGIITMINRFRNYDILLTIHIRLNQSINKSNIKIKYKYLDDKYYTLTLKQSYLFKISNTSTNINTNTNTNTIFPVNQLKNKGLYNPETKKRGNVYITINII